MVSNWSGGKGVVQMLEMMANTQNANNDAVQKYQEFISNIWEVGRGNKDASFKALQFMLESPEVSEKLMQAFYFRNPQTGDIMTVLPTGAISGFIENIRKLVLGEGEWDDKFKEVIKAFEQVNMERSGLVNKQGKTIEEMANNLQNFDLNQENATEKLKELIDKFNPENGGLFNEKTMNMGEIAMNLQGGSAASQDIDSITGEKMGTSKVFNNLKMSWPKPNGTPGAAFDNSKFILKKP